MGFVIHCISRRMKPSQDFSVNLEEKYVSSKEALCQMDCSSVLVATRYSLLINI